MIDKDVKIRKGLPLRRDSACLQTTADILIPAGTILRTTGESEFGCEIGLGDLTVRGKLTIALKPHEQCPSNVKRVVAA